MADDDASVALNEVSDVFCRNARTGSFIWAIDLAGLYRKRAFVTLATPVPDPYIMNGAPCCCNEMPFSLC